MMLLLCYFCYFAIFTFLYMMLLLCYFCYFAIFNSPLILCYFCYFALLDHPFLRNLAKKGSLGAKILLDNVKFMVDLWHCQKLHACLILTIQNVFITPNYLRSQQFIVSTQNVQNKHLISGSESLNL